MIAKKKTRARFAACLLTVLLIPLLIGCSLEELTGIGSFIPEKQVGFYINDEKIEIEFPENGGYFADLSDDQKKIYAAAIKAIEAGANSFICAGVDYQEYLDSYGEALTALLYDRPEYFWISGEAVASAEYIEGTDYGNVKVELSIYGYWLEADLFEAQESFNKAVDDIVSQASLLESNYEKVKFVHDILIKNASYDYESYDAAGALDTEAQAISNTAYGAIVAGEAMCGGYSRGFGYIMRLLGIESFYVTGEADGGPHAWNIIKLDGEFYHIDLTWDDADGDPCDILYSYFCVTDEEIFKTHTIDSDFNNMNAISTDYNYFIREGLYIEKYNFNAVNEMLKGRDIGDSFSFKCASSVVLKFAVENLIENSKFYDLEFVDESDSYQYIVDEEHYIITFVID